MMLLITLFLFFSSIHGWKYAYTITYYSPSYCNNNFRDGDTLWEFYPTTPLDTSKTCTYYESGNYYYGFEYINTTHLWHRHHCSDDECLTCANENMRPLDGCYGSTRYAWLPDEEEYIFPFGYMMQWQLMYNSSNNCDTESFLYTLVSVNGDCDEWDCVGGQTETVRCTYGQEWSGMTGECASCFPSWVLLFSEESFVFGEDSIVKTAEGEKKLLKDLEIGDRILTLNSQTSEVEEDEILEILFHKNPGNIREIHYRVIDEEGEGTLSISENHHMYFSEDSKDVNEIIRSESKESGELKVGDRIVVKLDKLHVGEIIGFTKSDVMKRVGVFYTKNNDQVFVDDVLVSVYSRTSIKFSGFEIACQKIWMSIIKISRVLFAENGYLDKFLRFGMMFLVENVYQRFF